MKKKVFNPFQTRIVKGDIVEVWEGKPGEAESEFVCSIQQTLVAGLIQALQKVEPKA